MYQDFVARMASAKAAAVHKRNRGGTTGAHKSHTVRISDRAPIDQGSWDYAKILALSGWNHDRDAAIDGYASAVFPERFEALDWKWRDV